MAKKRTYILPASGHELWVASFDPGDLAWIKNDDDLMGALEVQPIIGWVYVHQEGEVEPALELTPLGQLLPGIVRFVGESSEVAGDIGLQGIRMSWEKHKAFMAEREGSSGDLPVTGAESPVAGP